MRVIGGGEKTAGGKDVLASAGTYGCCNAMMG